MVSREDTDGHLSSVSRKHGTQLIQHSTHGVHTGISNFAHPVKSEVQGNVCIYTREPPIEETSRLFVLLLTNRFERRHLIGRQMMVVIKSRHSREQGPFRGEGIFFGSYKEGSSYCCSGRRLKIHNPPRGHSECVSLCVCFVLCIIDAYTFCGRWSYQPGSHRRRATHELVFLHLPSAVPP